MPPPKKKAKKRRLGAATSAVNLDGLVNFGDEGAASLEDCLGELEGPSVAVTAATKPVGHDDNVQESKASNSPKETTVQSDGRNQPVAPSKSLARLVGQTSTALSKRRRDRIQNWKTSFQSWQNHGRYTPGLLPSFDVELARHFKVQELSTFLLEACPGLRMPPFERWLMDCKVEERRHNHDDDNAADDEEEHANGKHIPHWKRHKRKRNAHHAGASPNIDVILASQPQRLPASQRLAQEIVESSRSSSDHPMSLVQAQKKVQELCRRTTAAVEELQQKMRQFANQAPLPKGDRIVVEAGKKDGTNDASLSLVYHRKRWKQPFRIRLNQSHYDKLQQAFCQTHGLSLSSFGLDHGNQKKRSILHIFHLLVMTLSLRYSSLSGGQLLKDLRGGGMQGAIHETVFDVLADEFSSATIVEGFASPFNNACANYASAFADLDYHFGAMGSFWELNESFMSGSSSSSSKNQKESLVCEVNPPFAPALMNQMVDHMQQLLRTAASHDQSQQEPSHPVLSFVVIVPTAHARGNQNGGGGETIPLARQFASTSFQSMIESPFCTAHFVLPARDHGYVEGAQHMRPTRYKESQYDTSVIVLQSSQVSRAGSSLLNIERLEARIRKSFQSRHLEELANRRQRKQRNDNDDDENHGDSSSGSSDS